MKCLITLAALINLIYISRIQSQALKDPSAKDVGRVLEEGTERNVLILDLVETSGNNNGNTEQYNINSGNSSIGTGSATERSYNNGEKSRERYTYQQNMDVLEQRNSNSGLLGNVFGYFTGMFQDNDESKNYKSTNKDTDRGVKSAQQTDVSTYETITQTDKVTNDVKKVSPNKHVNSNYLKEIREPNDNMNPEELPSSDQPNIIGASESSSNVITDIGKNLLNTFISNSKDNPGVTTNILQTYIPNFKDNTDISTVNSNILSSTDNLFTKKVAEVLPYKDIISDSMTGMNWPNDAKNSEETPEFEKENFVQPSDSQSNINMPLESSLNLITDIGQNLFSTFITNSKGNTGTAKTILNALLSNSKDNSSVAKNLLQTFIPNSMDKSIASKATVNTVIPNSRDSLSTGEVEKESNKQDLNSGSLTMTKEADHAKNPEGNPEFGKKEYPMQSNNIEKNSKMSESSSNLITDIGKSLFNTLITNSKNDSGIVRNLLQTFTPKYKDDLGVATNLLNTLVPNSEDSLSVAKNMLSTLIPDNKDSLGVVKTVLNTFVPDSKDITKGVTNSLLNTLIASGNGDKSVAKTLLNSFIPDPKDITLGVAKSLINTFISSSNDGTSIMKNSLNTNNPNSKNDLGIVGNAYNSLSKLFARKPKSSSSQTSNTLSDLASKLVRGKDNVIKEKEDGKDVQHDLTVNQEQVKYNPFGKMEPIKYDDNINENQEPAQIKPSINSQTNLHDSKNIVLPESVSTNFPTRPPNNYEYLLKEINQNIKIIGEHITKNTQNTDKHTLPDSNNENYEIQNTDNGQTSSVQACSSNLFDLAFRPPKNGVFHLASHQGSGSNLYPPNNIQQQSSLACLNPPCIVRYCPQACACPLYCSKVEQISCPCCPPCDPYPHYLYPQCR